MKEYILALDQGTTSSRAILFDGNAKIIAQSQKEFSQFYPRPGWVEHNPEAIWNTQLETARAAIAQSHLSPQQIAAIGIANQRETTIVWERNTGKPIYNAIVWQCRRTAPICDQLKAEGFDQVILEKTGLVTDPYFSATKLVWILENVPSARKKAERGELAFGTIDTFLLWRLSKGAIHRTDPSNASRTMLYNIHTHSWDTEILKHLDIPPSLLPEVQPSAALFGESDPEFFGASIPIAGVAGDQQAATFGQACYEPGTAKNTYGTGCFLLLNTGDRVVKSNYGLLSTIGWQLNSNPSTLTYCLEGSVFIAGAAVQWLHDCLGLIKKSSEIEMLASSVPDNGGLYFVPAFVGLGAPYWDPYARGLMIGLTRGTRPAHIARATLESIAFQTRDVVEAMRLDADLDLKSLRVDGGASSNNVLMQFQADILGVPVLRPSILETTALGAAYLAGLGSGFYKSLDDISTCWQLDTEFLPTISDDHREDIYHLWKKAVDRSRAWSQE
jgi:glycerol kinase